MSENSEQPDVHLSPAYALGFATAVRWVRAEGFTDMADWLNRQFASRIRLAEMGFTHPELSPSDIQAEMKRRENQAP